LPCHEAADSSTGITRGHTHKEDKRELKANAALTGGKEVVPIEGKAHAAYTLTSKFPKDVSRTPHLEFVGVAARADHCYTTWSHTPFKSAQLENVFQRQLT